MNSQVATNHHASDSSAPGSKYSQGDRSSLGSSSSRFFGTIRFWGAVLILCTFVVVGCKAFLDPESEGLLLNADFEGYGEGEPIVPTGDDVDPLAGDDIRGLPSGDKVIVCSPIPDPDSEKICFPNCNGSTYSVRSNDPLAGQKSLVYQYARLPHCEEGCGICEDFAFIDFVPEPPSVPVSLNERVIPILFFWNGRLSNELDDTVVEITIREKGAVFSILRLLVSHDRMEVRLGNTLVEVVIQDFSRKHSIFVRVSPPDTGSPDPGMYGIQIADTNLVTPPNNLDPCVFPNVVCGEFSTNNYDPAKLILRMRFSGTEPSVSALTQPDYTIDNVKIVQE